MLLPYSLQKKHPFRSHSHRGVYTVIRGVLFFTAIFAAFLDPHLAALGVWYYWELCAFLLQLRSGISILSYTAPHFAGLKSTTPVIANPVNSCPVNVNKPI